MRRTCRVCGVEFDGRSDATMCSPKCRKRASRARQGGDVVPLGVITPTATPGPSAGVLEATRAALAELGALGSPEAAAVLVAAERIDSRDDSGSSLAALIRQHAVLMGQLRAMFARPERDALDELRERRAGRGA